MRYKVYEINYNKGYGPGEAHFIEPMQGRYILRIKTENYPNERELVINYCSHCKFDMQQTILNKVDTSNLLRQCMIFAGKKSPKFSLDKNKRQE